MPIPIQTEYKDTLDEYVAGQQANTIKAKVLSGVLSNPASTLFFGRACQWTGDQTIDVGVSRSPIGTISSAVSNSTAFTMQVLPGMSLPSIGDTLIIGTNSVVVSAIGNTPDTYTASAAFSAAADAPVYLNAGGPTTLAGMAMIDTTAHAVNGADAFRYQDIVPIGAEGDFVAEVEMAATDHIAFGDPVGVYVGASDSDYGKFTNRPASTSVVGIRDAKFRSSARLINGKLVAMIRLPYIST